MIWLANTIITLLIGILCLWESTISMREQGTIAWFLPPFLFGVASCMLSALYFYELAGTAWHMFFTAVYLLSVATFVGAYFYLLAHEQE